MIRFSKIWRLTSTFSLLVCGIGLGSLLVFGLRSSVEFTGGTVIEAQAEQQTLQAIVSSVVQSTEDIQVTPIDEQRIRIRIPALTSDQDTLLTQRLREASGSVTLLRSETVGPTIGRELLFKALVAAGVAIIAILIYVAWAFKTVSYGVAAIVALIHDVVITLGVFSLLGRLVGIEVDALFVTAVLTTMSFSVHDTIVVFDRMREIQYTSGKQRSFRDIADSAVSQTFSRSLANSLTIVVMLAALTLFGGGAIRVFAGALLLGTISGTYSSPFVAVPVLVFLRNRWRR